MVLVTAYFVWSISPKDLAALRSHYDELNDGVFEPFSKLPPKLPVDLRNIPIGKPTCESALLHLAEEVPDASSILARLNEWGKQVQSVKLEVDNLVIELSGVRPDDTIAGLRMNWQG